MLKLQKKWVQHFRSAGERHQCGQMLVFSLIEIRRIDERRFFSGFYYLVVENSIVVRYTVDILMGNKQSQACTLDMVTNSVVVKARGCQT